MKWPTAKSGAFKIVAGMKAASPQDHRVLILPSKVCCHLSKCRHALCCIVVSNSIPESKISLLTVSQCQHLSFKQQPYCKACLVVGGMLLILFCFRLESCQGVDAASPAGLSGLLPLTGTLNSMALGWMQASHYKEPLGRGCRLTHPCTLTQGKSNGTSSLRTRPAMASSACRPTRCSRQKRPG